MHTVTERQHRLGKGEPFVWLTSAGLAVGLLMVVFILGLIVWEGLSAFWPKPVALLTLATPPGTKTTTPPPVAGELVKVQTRLGTGGKTLEEMYYVANRDLYGYSFKFLDQHAIASYSYPRDLMRIERIANGTVLGVPQTLALKDGAPIPFGTNAFDAKLASLVSQSADRRDEIYGVEAGGIGRLNATIERYRLKLRTMDRQQAQGLPVNEAERKSYQDLIAARQHDYEGLAAKAHALRELQKDDHLVLRTAEGKELIVGIGDMVSYFYPNRLGWWGRTRVFVYRLWEFFSNAPREANTEGGIFPAIFGTFVMTVLMSLAVTPFGVLAAIYLREYARQGVMVRLVRIAVNNLAGVPSIVFGVFGLGFFVYVVGGSIDSLFFTESLPTPTFKTGGVLWAALTLALLTVPVVVVATEEALAAVPRGVREGSLALGASKWLTIQRVVLPAAAPGIMTGLILAMARGAGEVAPLMMVGVVKLAPALPINFSYPYLHLDQKFMHLGFYIYDLGFQSPDSDAARPMVFATTLFLIVLVVALNLTGIIIRERLRRKYRTGAF